LSYLLSPIKIQVNKNYLDLYQNRRFSEAAVYLQSVYSENTNDPGEPAQPGYTNIMAGNLPAAEKIS